MKNSKSKIIDSNKDDSQSVYGEWNCMDVPGHNITWGEFTGLNIAPVVIRTNATGETRSETVSDPSQDATHWSIYGVRECGDLELLHDAESLPEAMLKVNVVSVHEKLEVNISK